MPAKGREHFDAYTAQNRVKHAILAKYFQAYLQALNRTADAFFYIDGFAGPGTYAAEHAGSPVYALDLLAQQQKPATAAFIEADAPLFAELEATVQRASRLDSLWAEPWVRRAEFSECLDEILSHPIFARFRKVGTFAFVDPCGLKGLLMLDFARLLRLPFAECLLFLNYDGLNRWLGAVRAGTHARERLDGFFGTSEAAADALECLESKGPSHEARLLDIYVKSLKENSGAEFVLAFRVRARDRNRTSHYLIHLAQHALAFKIMKEVMRGESQESADYGSFGFIPDAELSGQGELFRPNEARARTDILQELDHGARPVRLFLEEWPLRPTDMLVQKEYRQLLLALEAEQLIEVLDGDTGARVPASTRPKRAGAPTLSPRYKVRLRV